MQFPFIQLKVMRAISLFPCHIHSWFKWYKNFKKSIKTSRSYCQVFMDHSVHIMCAWYTVRKCIITPKWRCWWSNTLRIWNTRHWADSESAWTYILSYWFLHGPYNSAAQIRSHVFSLEESTKRDITKSHRVVTFRLFEANFPLNEILLKLASE